MQTWKRGRKENPINWCNSTENWLNIFCLLGFDGAVVYRVVLCPLRLSFHFSVLFLEVSSVCCLSNLRTKNEHRFIGIQGKVWSIFHYWNWLFVSSVSLTCSLYLRSPELEPTQLFFLWRFKSTQHPISQLYWSLIFMTFYLICYSQWGVVEENLSLGRKTLSFHYENSQRKLSMIFSWTDNANGSEAK